MYAYTEEGRGEGGMTVTVIIMVLIPTRGARRIEQRREEEGVGYWWGYDGEDTTREVKGNIL